MSEETPEIEPTEPEERPKRRRRRKPARSSEAGEAASSAEPPQAMPADEASRAEAQGAVDDGSAQVQEEPVAQPTEPEAADAETEEPAADAEADTAAPDTEAETPAPPARRGAPAPRRRRRRGELLDVEVRAQAKYVHSSARKARLVCDHIRGKSVEEARAILAHTPRAIARDWSKLLESAVANAEHNHELIGEDLYVKAVRADEGPTIKRYRPRALGRATRIRKRTSHLTILLKPKP